MQLTNFYLANGFVDLYFSNRQSERVYFNQYTGNIYKRPKVHPVLQYVIDHKGIYLGKTQDGTGWLIHNHINPGYADFVSWNDFAQGYTPEFDEKYCTNDVNTRIRIALNNVKDSTPYDPAFNSCQTLVNDVCTSEPKNDDTLRVVAGVGLFALGAWAIGTLIEALVNER